MLTDSLPQHPGQSVTQHPQQKVWKFFLRASMYLEHLLASDPAQNPYWKRDVRRAHPQLSVVTQSQLSQLLIEHSGTETYVHWIFSSLMPKNLTHRVVAPEDTSQVTVESLEPTTLSQAIAAVTGTTKVYSEDKLPPSPPISFQRWEPVRSDDAPHAPFSYFPMVMYH